MTDVQLTAAPWDTPEDGHVTVQEALARAQDAGRLPHRRVKFSTDRTWHAQFATGLGNGVVVHTTSTINPRQPGHRFNRRDFAVPAHTIEQMIESAIGKAYVNWKRFVHQHALHPLTDVHVTFNADAYREHLNIRAAATRTAWAGALRSGDVTEQIRAFGVVLATAWKGKFLAVTPGARLSVNVAETLVDAGGIKVLHGEPGSMNVALRVGYIGAGSFSVHTDSMAMVVASDGDPVQTVLDVIASTVEALNAKISKLADLLNTIDLSGQPDPYAKAAAYPCDRVTSAGKRCTFFGPAEGEPCANHVRFDQDHPERPSVPFQEEWAHRADPQVGQWVRFARPFTINGNVVDTWRRVTQSAFWAPGCGNQPLLGWRGGDFEILDESEAPDLGPHLVEGLRHLLTDEQYQDALTWTCAGPGRNGAGCTARVLGANIARLGKVREGYWELTHAQYDRVFNARTCTACTP